MPKVTLAILLYTSLFLYNLCACSQFFKIFKWLWEEVGEEARRGGRRGRAEVGNGKEQQEPIIFTTWNCRQWFTGLCYKLIQRLRSFLWNCFVVFKLQHVSQLPLGFVKTQIANPISKFLIWAWKYSVILTMTYNFQGDWYIWEE